MKEKIVRMPFAWTKGCPTKTGVYIATYKDENKSRTVRFEYQAEDWPMFSDRLELDKVVAHALLPIPINKGKMPKIASVDGIGVVEWHLNSFPQKEGRYLIFWGVDEAGSYPNCARLSFIDFYRDENSKIAPSKRSIPKITAWAEVPDPFVEDVQNLLGHGKAWYDVKVPVIFCHGQNVVMSLTTAGRAANREDGSNPIGPDFEVIERFYKKKRPNGFTDYLLIIRRKSDGKAFFTKISDDSWPEDRMMIGDQYYVCFKPIKVRKVVKTVVETVYGR